MEEQVVPGLPVSKVISNRETSIRLRSKKLVTVNKAVDHAVPALRSAKRLKTEPEALSGVANISVLSPTAEYNGKPRWTTPLRSGKWLERWESARELGLHVAVRSRERNDISKVIRSAIAEAVVANVGGVLPVATVLKWLCLLFEYLELNADEQVLVVCLLRKYVSAGGKFVGEGDWARPQRWECVVAISCYFAVLLTEEFPGRTSLDLRELLGPNFRFGKEQLLFLRTVDWRISVNDAYFDEVKKCCVAVAEDKSGEKERLMDWFRLSKPVQERDLLPSVAEAPKTPAPVALGVKTTAPYYSNSTNMKKRPFAAIAPADDSMVPFVAHYTALAPVIPSVPQWMPHGW